MTRIPTSPWFSRGVTAIAFAAICLLDWLVGHGRLVPFYGVPVVLSAWRDGWIGALTVALLSSVAIFAVPGDNDLLSRAAASLGIAGAGLTAGYALARERTQQDILQNHVDELSSVYERVQANFEGMKRIERLSAIGQLSAGLAHEIRNPLASIAGAASILRRNEHLEPKHAKCVEIIASECERLNGLVTNFLDFARPRPPQLKTIEIEAVLDNVLALASHGLRGKVVRIEKHTEPDLPQVECDPEQLEQVLLNLMINAIEASPNGETVTLSAETREGHVAILVIDEGEGVAPAHIDRLFDPFFTTKEHGTGLGLPVAHQIMVQMGGSLLAQRNAGKGMTFSIILAARHGKP